MTISCLTIQKKGEKHSFAECGGRQACKNVWHSNIGYVMFYFTRIYGDEICMKQLEAATEIQSEADQRRPRTGLQHIRQLTADLLHDWNDEEKKNFPSSTKTTGVERVNTSASS